MNEYIVKRDDVLKRREIEVKISLNDEQRKEFSQDLENAEALALSAAFIVKPYRGKKGLSVKGEVSGNFARACVVTLKPLEEAVKEKIDIRFLPADEMKQPVINGESEISDILSSEFDLEEMVAEEVDLFAVMREYVILALDPYPKAADAAFQEFTTDIEGVNLLEEGEAEVRRDENGLPVVKPFAILAEYRDRILKK